MSRTERPDPRYLVTLDEIYHSHWAAKKKHRILRLERAFRHFWPEGHPTRLIQITGTNGKGSVAHYLEQGLGLSGPAGSWTGPHVFDYAERFHLDGEIARREEIVEIYRQKLEPYQRSRVAVADRELLGFAELGILISLFLFERHRVRWGLMEVGVGGRYTPLMALPMTACVLTNVGDDHPITLGSEPWQRALEKSGIARPGVPFFTSVQEELLPLVETAVRAEGAECFAVGPRQTSEVAKALPSLPGYEQSNLALALAVIRHLEPEVPAERALEAMTQRLPGRFWSPEPDLIVDVAHNRGKIAALAERLQLVYPGRTFRCLLGLTRKRDPVEVFSPLFEVASHLTVTGASYAGQDPEATARRLAEAFPNVGWERDPKRALARGRAALGEGERLVVTGSAYLIDQALNPDPYVQHLNASYGWRAKGDDSNKGS